MKRLLCVIIFLLIPGFAMAETVTLTTYYPSPFGSYDRLKLVPRSTIVALPCDDGTFYVEDTNNTLQFCRNGAWGFLAGAWTQVNDDPNPASVYPTDTARDIMVGIGTTEPGATLHVDTGDLTAPVDWTSDDGFGNGLYGSMVLTGTNPSFTIIGEDDTAFSSGLRLSEVDNAGGYLDAWYLVRGTSTANTSKLFLKYVSKAGPVTDWWTNQATKLTITKDGSVGIGTTDPQDTLHIKGTGEITLEEVSTGITFRDTGPIGGNDDFQIKTSNPNSLKIKADPGDTGVWNTLVTVLSDGKVGFGTTGPEEDLHIMGNGEIILEHGSTAVEFRDLDETRKSFRLANFDSLFSIRTRTGNAALWNADPIRLRIDGATGNVGIGEANPASLLHLKTITNAPLLRLTSDVSSEIMFEPDNNPNNRFEFWAFDGYFGISDFSTGVSRNIVRIMGATGNVGIGTTNPQGKLDVNGSIFLSGIFHADYVFESDFELESIEEHAEYMWNNKHLKAVPKAVQDEEGRGPVDIGLRSKGILEELEKAHIYIEQLNNSLKKVHKENNALKGIICKNYPKETICQH